jgi:hypothetical protein
MAEMPDPGPPLATLLDLLGPGDDPALWRLAAEKGLAQAAGLLEELEPRPRRVVVTFAAIPRRHPETHPDDAALWRRSFALERGDAGWRDEGAAPRLRRKRGHFALTVCVPGGTRRLAAVEVTCLWRPRFPWAPPEETEIGREVRVFLRDGAGEWQPRGVHG